MNENINLCEILKGHEGELFYTTCWGYVELTKVSNYVLYFDDTFKTNIQGKINDRGECVIFPSKDQRDWDKWDKENNHKTPKTPKTWSELVEARDIFTEFAEIGSNHGADSSKTFSETLIEKSALALLKIHQLIEVGYGGNVTREEWNKNKSIYCIVCYKGDFITITTSNSYKHFIAFHTKEQAEEFLKYPENVQLLKDYFQIN